MRADGVGIDVELDREARAPRDPLELDLQRHGQAAIGERGRVQAEDGLAQRAHGVGQRLVGVLQRLQVAGARLAHVLLGGEQRLQRVVVQPLADPRALALLGIERLVQERRAVDAELLDLARPALHGLREQDADRADDEERDERLRERGLLGAAVEARHGDRDEAGSRERRDERDRRRPVGEPHGERIDDEQQARLRRRAAAERDEGDDERDVDERDPEQRRAQAPAGGEDGQHDGVGAAERERDEEPGARLVGPDQHGDRDDDRSGDPQRGERLR